MLVIFLVFMMLAACSLQSSDETNFSDKNLSPTHEATTSATEDISTPSQDEIGGDSTDISVPQWDEARGDSITYANVGTKANDLFSSKSSIYFLPISCILDGEQLLYGDFGDSSERRLGTAMSLGRAPAAEKLVTVSVKEHMFVGTERPDYGFDLVAASGDWELFPEKVTYTSYDLEHQPQKPEWSEYFGKSLAEEGIDSPMVIKDTWAFQWDGVESVIVTATNAIPCENGYQSYEVGEEPIPETLPTNERPGIYLMSALFRSEQDPCMLQYTIMNLSIETGYSYGLAPPVEVSDFYSRSVSVVQYDEAGSFAVYPVYCGHLGTESISFFWYPPEYLLSDIDGDGMVELTIYRRSAYSLYEMCQVYELVDGIPTCTASFSPLISSMF